MNKEQLDHLFQLLRTSQKEDEIQQTIEDIWQVWMTELSPAVGLLMDRGCKAMADGDFTEAIHDFSTIISEMPEYAEGWNKRATALYLRGDYKRSIDDIQKTLELEPRHFGALSGWATICLIIGDEQKALSLFRELEQIYPNRKGLRKKINTLSTKLGLDDN